MDRERIIQLFFFGFLAVVAYELFVLIEPFLVPVAWAILLAFVAHPALIALDRLVHRRSLSAVILTIAIALGVILPAIWLSGRLVNEAHTLYTQVSGMVDDGGLSQARDWASHSEFIAAINRRLGSHGIKLEEEIPKRAVQAAQVASEYVARSLTSAARNVVVAVLDFGIILMTFFYLLRDGEGYFRGLRDLTPLHEEDKAAVYQTLSATLSAVMRGMMLTALLQGVLIGLGYLLSGVPYWAFLAILTAGGGLLPIGGTAVIWVPATLYLAYTAGLAHAVTLFIWCVICVAVIDNFLKPLAMRGGTGLPTLALFFGIAGGLEAYGPIGLFLGPAIVSVFAALLRVYRKTYGNTPDEAA
ncbi:MAG TPA: AI-2E family transporter [Candidatus Binataceae bacterium]|nr:AI-2E family transporter [Candidatus Binataceae bacterium]